jgi:hypothetical protein
MLAQMAAAEAVAHLLGSSGCQTVEQTMHERVREEMPHLTAAAAAAEAVVPQ